MTPKRIAGVKFGLLSPKEIRRMSAAKIITADTYDRDGFPIDMGLMSQHLGVVDPGLRCKTCGGRPGECPGHFGHIELAAPTIHVGYAKHIAKILRSICCECSRLLLDEMERSKYEKKEKRKRITTSIFKEASSKSICPWCGAPTRGIKFEKPTTYIEDGQRLMPIEIRERFERIPDEDVLLLGMDPNNARPEWMILTVLPVPPVTIRPSITLESGQRSEDDLTHKLVDIIRINQRFQENKDAGAPQLILEDLWELLQFHITTLFDNTVSGVPPARHRSGRPLKTLSQRLKGKEGRFRESLSGKRVNFSARTVISPDSNIGVNEVGVPVHVASELTIPITVTRRNIEDVRRMVRRGLNYPGVNYVRRTDGKRIRVNEKNCDELAEKLEVGCVVDAQLRDGDIVLFNRQPSLHRMSIMAHEVRTLDDKTFRLNPAVCPPYNADFDGDEMNLHVLQTEEARAEAKILMDVQENILSPRFGGPIIGGLHDYISGSFLLTMGETKFDRRSAMYLVGKIDEELPDPIVSKGEHYYTGKQIFSQALPVGLNMTFKASICIGCEKCKREECDRDAYVVIEDGKLLHGVIDENSIGTLKGKILDRIAKEYGSEEARKFIERVCKLALCILLQFGFSFGISDEDIQKDARANIERMIELRENKIKEIMEAAEEGELDSWPGRTIDETAEAEIMRQLSGARNDTGNVVESDLVSYPSRRVQIVDKDWKVIGERDLEQLDIRKSSVVMAKSGARGSMLNLSQMAGCVGQQSVRGERIKRGYHERALPHFKRGDQGAEANGFVRSSYKTGLSPTEFFFHAIGGREGLVDTAVRTSQSGYFQRRLINALQDLEVNIDNTVREKGGTIIQFEYGEDGVDPAKSDYGKINIQKIVNEIVEEA
jgi:DNA-directed RNA polymerase subunit A'